MRETIEKLELKSKRGPDDAFKRLVFLGLPKISFEKRVQHMVSYMKEHFPSVQCTCSVYFKMCDAKRDRVMTDTGFVEFITSDVREFVLSDIESNPEKHKFVMDGKVITVRQARTRRATERNTALRNAAGL